MTQLRFDNLGVLTKLGIEISDTTSLDLAQINFLDKGKNVMPKETLLEMIRKTTNLKALLLLSVTQLNDSVLSTIAQTVPNLQYISLRECAGITDTGLTSLATSCKNLKGIDLAFCSNITGDGLTTVINSCPNLEFIKITCVKTISDDTFAELGQKCPRIRFLDGLEEQFSDKVLQYLSECRLLSSLDCSNRNFTLEGLTALKSKLPNLFLKNVRMPITANGTTTPSSTSLPPFNFSLPKPTPAINPITLPQPQSFSLSQSTTLTLPTEPLPTTNDAPNALSLSLPPFATAEQN
jgi:hypothetical protein